MNRFFGHSEQHGGSARYVTRDHLGSVREVADSSGSVVTRNDYDPYGRLTRVGGTEDSKFGFTGHYTHSPTGLSLALFRAYDPSACRWLSADPIREAGGLNLYAYVEGNPIGGVDGLGLDYIDSSLSGSVNVAAGFGDYLSGGLTEDARDYLGYNDVVNQCSWGYVAGIGLGVLFDIAARGGSVYLKRLARVSTKPLKDRDRRLARAAMKKVGKYVEGKKAHHRNPLDGHPAVKGLGNGATLFPTVGLPDWIKNHRWNLVMLDDAAHNAAHLLMRRQEAFAYYALGIANPVIASVRVSLSAARLTDSD